MNKEFEKWAVEERGYSVPKFELTPCQYVEDRTHIAWTAWKASRESLVIDLPTTSTYDSYEVRYYADDVKEAIEQQGVKWK